MSQKVDEIYRKIMRISGLALICMVLSETPVQWVLLSTGSVFLLEGILGGIRSNGKT